MGRNGYLDKAYGVSGTEATRKLYDDWSESYDSEIGENGYATPGRLAAALRKHASDMTMDILDFGCGTGLCGAKLNSAGFENIDGLDLSAEMLEKARQKKIYRKLLHIEPDAPLPISPGTYNAITACGVIGVGAAPLCVFDTIMNVLNRGGKFAFSYNDHTLEDPAYLAKLSEYTDCGAARLHLCEHGPHLPGINLNSTVYVIEKL